MHHPYIVLYLHAVEDVEGFIVSNNVEGLLYRGAFAFGPYELLVRCIDQSFRA